MLQRKAAKLFFWMAAFWKAYPITAIFAFRN